MSEMKQGLYHVKWWLRGVYGDPEGEFDILTSDDDAEIREEAWNRAQKMTNAGRPEYLEFIKVLVTPADPPPAAQPDDDARLAEIRAQLEALELIANIQRERLTYPASSEERYCLKQLIIIGAEEVLTHTGFNAAAAIRDLLTRLDAVTRERDRALRAGFAEYQDTPGIHTASFEEWCKRVLKESTDG